MIALWLEVHVDDVALERDDACWGETARVLDALATAAEACGARLSFRLRERFAGMDRHGFTAGLVARGHEVGWHAHGRRLRQARDAVVAAGGTAAVAAPGLVQARNWRGLLEEARRLGARRVTDRVERRLFAYQGWLAWEPIPGLLSTDVSVSPFDWGVLERVGGRVRPGRLDADALLGRIVMQDRWAPPPGAAAFFGATFHEHDVMREGRLDPARLDTVRRLLDRLGPRVRPSAQVRGECEGGVVSARGGRIRRLLLGIERRFRGEDREIVVGDRVVRARRVGPRDARAVVVLVHGGKSGIAQGLGFCGVRDLGDIAVWSFERSEGARTPGNPVHLADTRAVLAAALAEGKPTAVMTWSAGLIPGLNAVLAEPRVRVLIDAEGPVDRFSLVPPEQPEHELAEVEVWDDAAWAGREPVTHIGEFTGRYVRLQAEEDHVHGRMHWHARRMVAAARDGRLNDGDLLPGRLDQHGERIREWVRGAVLGASRE